MPKGGASSEFPIKNFRGLNLKDAADKVADNEFTKLQNVYRSSQGIFQRRFGSVADVSSIPLCKIVSGVWRHYGQNREKFTLYHCVPDSTAFPDNTVDLVLTDVTSTTGNIFGGGAVVTLYVCYSWIGSGIEQTYNSRTRAGFPAAGSFPLDAHSNPGHQTITLGAAAHKLQVTVPAFPSGVRGANVFVARGTATEMCYMGTVTTSGGSLTIGSFIGPSGASQDAVSAQLIQAINSASGTLASGTYYISLAWLINNGAQEGFPDVFSTLTLLQTGSAPVWNAPTVSSSPVTGTLTPATQYDVTISISDAVTGAENWVSGVYTGTTSAADTSLVIALPVLPPGVQGTFNIYFGAHTATRYLVKTGLLPLDQYVVSAAPGSGTNAPSAITPSDVNPWCTKVSLTGQNNAIKVSAPALASTNGAKSLYVFIGTQPGNIQPMTCVGMINVGTPGVDLVDQTILSIPSHNGQSFPGAIAADQSAPNFWNGVNSIDNGSLQYDVTNKFQGRFGFLLCKKNGGSLTEIFPSRTLYLVAGLTATTAVYAGDDINGGYLHNFSPFIRTSNDKYRAIVGALTQPFQWDNTPVDPTFCRLNAISYFANGVDIPWQTDGYTLGQLTCVRSSVQTLLPPIPKVIGIYQNALIVAGAKADNQVYASNSNAPQNWATGGFGSLLRFVTIGDPVGSSVSATGQFTPATEATNNPGSFLISFKKHGIWMISTIPDPTTSFLAGSVSNQSPSPMIQVSGKSGCVAYRSVVQTPIGTLFMGSDGNVYLINRVAEPTKIGTKIQSLLSHLVGQDTYMAMCTAVFHNNHYKLSYPSAYAITQSPVVNDSELWADLRTENQEPISWVGPHTGRNIGAQVVFSGDGDDLSRFAADSSTVRTMNADTTAALDDFGTGIAYSIASKIFRFSEDSHLKRIWGAIIDAYIDMGYTNNMLFEGFADADYQQVNRNLSSGGAVWDSSQWDQSNYADAAWQGFSFNFGETNLNGRTFQWQLSGSDKSPFLLASVTLLLHAERRRIIN